MGETYSQHIRRQRLAQLIREFAAAPDERHTDRFAARIVALWNIRIARGAEPLFIPTIGAALRAGRPWLTYQCPACTMIGEEDLRRLDRHPQGSVESVIPALSCPRCPGGPFVRLLTLAAAPQMPARSRAKR